MPDTGFNGFRPLDAAKFRNPATTLQGDPRARVALKRLSTLWFNTGSVCNITCRGCYIESSPTNDRLAFLSVDEVRGYLDEAEALGLPVEEVGFTGGEPFVNRELLAMLEKALHRGRRALVLSNGLTPMWLKREALLTLRLRHCDRLRLRISLDHYTPEQHERVRGRNTWAPAIRGLRWLAEHGFALAVAGRRLWDEDEPSLRAGFARLFAAEGIALDAADPSALLLFPEMNEGRDVPEISERCWNILKVSPDAMMCASSRMVIKRKGSQLPSVVPCTLLPYDPSFELGDRLADATKPVTLNHPFCAQFCVLGGATCSPSAG